MILTISLLAIAGAGVICFCGYIWKRVEETDDMINRIDEQYRCAMAGFAASLEKINDDINDLELKLNDLQLKLKDSEERTAEAEKEIKAWNDGLSNIMSYTADTAKGGVKKK